MASEKNKEEIEKAIQEIKDSEITLQEAIETFKNEKQTINFFSEKYISDIPLYTDIAKTAFERLAKIKEKIDKIDFAKISGEFFKKMQDAAQQCAQELQPKIYDFLEKMSQEIESQKFFLLSEIKELLKKPGTTAKQRSNLEEMQKTLNSEDCYISYLQEAREELKRIRKEQEKKGGLVKVSMNLQQNLFCRTRQQNIDFVESLGLSEGQDKQKEIECKILNHKGLSDKSGKKPTMLEHRAIDAIATILSDRNHVAIASSGNRKIFQMTMTEYFENFAVTKVKTSRGSIEFSGKEKEEAIAALESIETKLFDCLWKMPLTNGKFRCFLGKVPMIHIIRCIGDLEQADIETLENAGITEKNLKGVLVIPNQIFWEHVDNYFCLKPRGMLAEIKKEKGKKNNKHINLFFEKICEQASVKKANSAAMIWDTTIESLAHAIDLESWIKTRQWKRIKATILDCLETAIKLGYITKYDLGISQKGKEKITITINESKIYSK